MTSLIDYAEVVGINTIEELFELADRLTHKSMLHVNSTAVGGGVAEMLNRKVPLFKELGFDTRWDVIKGGEDFFLVTKGLHNSLQGDPMMLSEDVIEIYLRYNRQNAEEMNFDEEFIFIHDPQPAALIEAKTRDNKWIWRCHIDISSPFGETWTFLKQFIERYNGTIFSRASFSRPDLNIKQFMITPSIDPLSEKNRELNQNEIDKVVDKLDINLEKPLITQIGRFDRFKDPIGVIKAYKLVKKHIDCQLILAGGLATDDPEGMEVYNEVQQHAEGDHDIHLLLSLSDLEVNALQRLSSVVLQKSLKEGFALTVSEALWKGIPVIGGAVGGIPLQIIDGFTGFLVHSIEGASNRILWLLRNPESAEKISENGKEHVKRNFLLTRHIRDHLLLMHALEHPGEDFIQL